MGTVVVTLSATSSFQTKEVLLSIFQTFYIQFQRVNSLGLCTISFLSYSFLRL